MNSEDIQSQTSSHSGGRSRGSSVLARARQYNQIIDEHRTRAKSLDRKSSVSVPTTTNTSKVSTKAKVTYDSQRDRAMASVQNSSPNRGRQTSKRSSPQQYINKTMNNNVSYNYSNASPSNNTAITAPIHSQTFSSTNTNNITILDNDPNDSHNHSHNNSNSHGNNIHNKSRTPQISNSPPTAEHNSNNNNNNNPTITPELLVDALSGHEDGLLAIAERLMENYDAGYDIMGEAIIDAFADVQKLFQHVVEAAHMEGAAYEAGRKEDEITKLRNALLTAGTDPYRLHDTTTNTPMMTLNSPTNDSTLDDRQYTNKSNQNNNNNNNNNNHNMSPGPIRHEEFVDQDVRDILLEAIHKTTPLRDANQYLECYQIFEQACQSASALLPVDSDHRGRLQLSIGRAECMNPERACSILKYVMDDILRSGLHVNSKISMPDPSQRGDCVLNRQMTLDPFDSLEHQNGIGEDGIVLQSSEEALNSLVEEMKEMLCAPVYDHSPLQDVANKFFTALTQSQRARSKNEDRLEQSLGSLKAEFLLARMEWEEKYNQLSRECEQYQDKLERLQSSHYMEQARSGVSKLTSSTSSDANHNITQKHHPQQQQEVENENDTTFSSISRSIAASFSCGGTPCKNSNTRKTINSSPPTSVNHNNNYGQNHIRYEK